MTLTHHYRHGSATILMFGLLLCQSVTGAPAHLVDESPVEIRKVEPGVYWVDFGRAAFGNIRLQPPSTMDGSVTVHFGEAMHDGRINRKPPGTVRYQVATATLDRGRSIVVAPPVDRRNTTTNRRNNPPAILTPDEWGVVLPFRWLEIGGWQGELKPEHVVRQAAFATTWDDDAAFFECSDSMLNQIWELCRYSIKATTFAGVYVDGDRERIPYEADAYLNQLSHYYTDNDKQMARDTIDHLLVHGTWPSEWPPHMIFMVHADWMWTGDLQWMAGRYEQLKSMTLANRRAAGGLIVSRPQDIKRTDIVDWPKLERDGYQFTERNTVVNAFYLQATKLMAEMARALSKVDEAEQFEADFKKSHANFQKTFFEAKTGLYNDGIGTEHKSLHANLFPLAFGLVPEDARAEIADWLAKRGMKCSVYAAQYLLEGLFENGADTLAVELMTAQNDRSWRHMVESGTTITWEAWDQKYKPNQDWNHAWGAAPANLLPRYILGVEPLSPGWKTVRIRPNLAGLTSAKGGVPTQDGTILVKWELLDTFTLLLILPEGMKACVELPMIWDSSELFVDGKLMDAPRDSGRRVIHVEGQERVAFEIKRR